MMCFVSPHFQLTKLTIMDLKNLLLSKDVQDFITESPDKMPPAVMHVVPKTESPFDIELPAGFQCDHFYRSLRPMVFNVESLKGSSGHVGQITDSKLEILASFTYLYQR